MFFPGFSSKPDIFIRKAIELWCQGQTGFPLVDYPRPIVDLFESAAANEKIYNGCL